MPAHEYPGKATAQETAGTDGQPATGASQAAGEDPAAGRTSDSASLLPQGAADDFRSRWQSIQHDFVDQPRDSMTQADALVSEVMRQLAETFDQQRRDLERRWSEGEPSTEELRTAFRRYRTFLDQLLDV